MQLDRTRISIRERTWSERLDLALHVLGTYLGPLSLAALCGMGPWLLANAWLLSAAGADVAREPFAYVWWLIVLTTLEASLATAPLTLYLGQALFVERPTPGRIARDFARSLPQLLVLQGIVRGLTMLPIVTAFLPLAVWPYLNEVILLERNPWRRRRVGELSTMSRSSALHAGMTGEGLTFWLGNLAVAAALVASVGGSLWFLLLIFVGQEYLTADALRFGLATTIWLVVGYLAVVRFLSYLDLRIRREGWEVELKLRAERGRLLGRAA